MITVKRRLLSGLESPTPSVDDVCAALQSALELEHATIPPYLYALYSLDADKNGQIAEIIKSVVTEEMLHMTLVANVLNALGGTPQLNHAGFVPAYPGPLPGGVESSLVVGLEAFSMAQLDTFLKIEEPETPIPFKAVLDADAAITIGQFYRTIIEALALLPAGAFVHPPRNQVGAELFAEAVVVADLASAQRALGTIVEQGEGTANSPEEGVGAGYAHYYRFMQIKKGKALIPSAGSYAYAGTPIVFDPSGVYRMPSNPTPALYQDFPAQRFAFDNFNYTYTSLLNALHALFNGADTARQFDVAIGLMMSLKLQAKVMAQGVAYSTNPTGPSFQYQGTNPAQPQEEHARR